MWSCLQFLSAFFKGLCCLKCQALVLYSSTLCPRLVSLLLLIVPNTCYKPSPWTNKNYRELDSKTNIYRKRSFIEPALFLSVQTLRLKNEIVCRYISWQMRAKSPSEASWWRQWRPRKHVFLPLDMVFQMVVSTQDRPSQLAHFLSWSWTHQLTTVDLSRIFLCACAIEQTDIALKVLPCPFIFEWRNFSSTGHISNVSQQD